MMELVNLAAMVLLPLIPAWILYRVLPSSGNVSGALGGFHIKLGGAFGGYFALVILMLWYGPKLAKDQVWTVTGQIGFEDQSQAPDLTSILVSSQPPSLDLDKTGRFTMQILVKPGQAGELVFPNLIAEHEGYIPANVDLSQHPPKFVKNYKVARDERTQNIVINEPVLLGTASRYNPGKSESFNGP